MTNLMGTKMAKQAITLDQVMALVNQLKEENETLKAKLVNGKGEAKVTCKVGEKGNLCIYGLGRFPVSLYVSQFDTLAKHWEEVTKFVADNRSKFAVKG